MIQFFFILLSLINSYQERFHSIYPKIKDELEQSPSEEKDDIAIKWALAKLSQQVGQTVSSDQIAKEVGWRIKQLIERVEITDAELKNDFNNMKSHFLETRQSIFDMVASTKELVIDQMENFVNEFNYSVLSVVESSKPIHKDYVSNSKNHIYNVFGSIAGASDLFSIVFFVCFQIMMIFGIINFHKVYRLFVMLL
ncbi:hypothetical protein M9Y10_017335 [Tritrichomonas musculus]|uniref:Uncharacterized protein n=1 Tax=Tritrichomonas musculus TaxID=1915356 RepID=A0ABR2HTH7_9EUKA